MGSRPIGKGELPLENRKITDLFRQLLIKKRTSAYEYPQVLTQLLFKCTIPLLPLLVVMGSAPYCIRHSRRPPIFQTYAIALFGVVALFALMDACVILGENNAASPIFIPIIPFIGFFLFGLHVKRC